MSDRKLAAIGVSMLMGLGLIAACSDSRPKASGVYVPAYRPVSGVPSIFSGELVTVSEALAERRMVEAYADAVVERLGDRR